jgi:hypothetical protein
LFYFYVCEAVPHSRLEQKFIEVWYSVAVFCAANAWLSKHRTLEAQRIPEYFGEIGSACEDCIALLPGKSGRSVDENVTSGETVESNQIGTRVSETKQESSVTMIQPYKGYFIDGTALLLHPFSSDWYVGGSVLTPIRLPQQPALIVQKLARLLNLFLYFFVGVLHILNPPRAILGTG